MIDHQLLSVSDQLSNCCLRCLFVQAWGMTRPTQSTRCGGGYGCQTRVSSQSAWDMYCDAAEELAMMSLNGYNNRHGGRGLAAAKISNDGSGFYSRQSLQYQKLQAIQVIAS